MSATTGVANLRPGRDGYLRAGAVCEVSNMEPVRATLEADLAVAPLARPRDPRKPGDHLSRPALTSATVRSIFT
jgi:hypothetical protein